LGLLFVYIRKKSALKKSFPTIIFAVIWLLIVTTLLCIPGTKLPKINWQDKVWLDKWIHVFLFFMLVVLWSLAYSRRTKINIKKIFILITILSVIYGIGMEIVQQYFIPFRSFVSGDIFADGIGYIIGYFISVKRFVKLDEDL
jgi:VanZ family protein